MDRRRWPCTQVPDRDGGSGVHRCHHSARLYGPSLRAHVQLRNDTSGNDNGALQLWYRAAACQSGAYETVRPVWWLTKDGDLDCAELYERHYSRYVYKDGRARHGGEFVGPGEKVVLRTERADALFVWRKFIDDSGQQGINCAVFRNESGHRSSELIRQADSIADCLWPDSRHYTYVNAQAIRSANPGFCFIAAGWKRCGRTRGGLIVLERLPVNGRGDA